MNYQDILGCLQKIKYTQHALKEMLSEEFGEITENELIAALKNGKIIEQYPDDRPVPSCLVLGYTRSKRPLHIVCAPLVEEGILVVITTYEPDPNKWDNFERRRK